ncbi:MAG: hypothetical protein PHW02_00840 [bacterium]|nr:hypothetical protein [bacterium]
MLLSFNLLILFITANSEPVILSPNARVAGSFDFLNPARYANEYDFIRFGAFNSFFSADMTTLLTQGNMHLKNFSAGGIILFRPNSVLSELTAGITGGYAHKQVSFGASILPSIKRYSDGVNEFYLRSLFSSCVSSNGFFLSASYGSSEGDFIWNCSAGYETNGMKVSFQAEDEGVLTLSGVISFTLNDALSLGIAGDTERRVFYSLDALKLPYKIGYSGMAHPDMPLSSGVTLSLVRGNPHYELTEVKPSNVKFEYGGKIKIKKKKSEIIDLNRCSYEEIMDVDSVSRVILRRIYVERLIGGEYKDYSRIDSLPGVGKVTLERIKEQTHIGEYYGEEEEE